MLLMREKIIRKLQIDAECWRNQLKPIGHVGGFIFFWMPLLLGEQSTFPHYLFSETDVGIG